MWANGKNVQPEYGWCCAVIETKESRVIIRKGTTSILYISQSIITSLFPSLHCFAHTTYCLLLDKIAIWTVSSSYTCKIIAGKRKEAEKHNDFIVSQEGQFVVKLKDSSEVHCSLTLKTTFEGILLMILSEQQQKLMPTFSSAIDVIA